VSEEAEEDGEWREVEQASSRSVVIVSVGLQVLNDHVGIGLYKVGRLMSSLLCHAHNRQQGGSESFLSLSCVSRPQNS